MSTILLLGDFAVGQSLGTIREGFELFGWRTLHLPTRACIRSHRQRDIDLSKEESDLIPNPEHWEFSCETDDEFCKNVHRVVEDERPDILLWWCSKEDRPAGLIEQIRERFEFCKTVTHTQDDPWNTWRDPQYTNGFEFAVTCCEESVANYAKRDIRAITLYPPVSPSLHLPAKPNKLEQCDFSVTMFSLYSKGDDDNADRDSTALEADKLTHRIGFPDQRVLRHELLEAVRELGKVNIYGGIGYGTFPGYPRASYRGFRLYHELPGVYQAAKINLNHHNSPLAHGYLNQRDTTITGSGAFMLTDHVAGIDELFNVGTEIDTWLTLEELNEKAQWWLAHDRHRQQAGKLAQRKIFSEYGSIAYARKLAKFVNS